MSKKPISGKEPPKKYERKKCPHGRQSCWCKDCGGVSVCEHGRQKRICKQCGGNGICEHGREKKRCKECGGSEICEHGRHKGICKQCGGTRICEHGRQKQICKICGGSSICEHNMRRKRCKQCEGCEHGRLKYQCKDCGGAGSCEHEHRKERCKICKGAGICIHKKRREFCNDPECDGGSALCCVPSCDKVFCKKYRGHCMTCFMSLFPAETVFRNYKTKEGAVLCSIKAAFSDLTIVNDRRIDGGCSQRRPDIFIDLLTHVIIVEIDENAHLAYDQNCENNRIVDISEDVAHRHVVFIRFNPDKSEAGPGCWTIDANGLAVIKKKRAAEWQERLAALNKTVEFWTTTIPNNLVEIVKLFY